MSITSFESVECERKIPANIFIASIDKSNFHWHFEYEIILVLKGPIIINCPSGNSILESGDIILINSKDVHEIRKKNENNICLFIQLPHDVFQDWKDPHCYYSFYLNSKGSGVYKNDAVNQIKKRCANIGFEYFNVGEKGSPRLLALVYSLIADFIELVPFERHQYSLKNNEHYASEKLMQIISYIHENYMNIDIAQNLLDEMNMSEKTMYRFLKQNIGMTQKEIINKCRIETAKIMLKHTDKNMNYIADECGFGSDITFYRCFKKEIGVTPNEYRINGGKVDKNPQIKGYLNFNKQESCKLLQTLMEDKK
ncbi:MAG: AraC family transcriptional regulator [Spirochaetales bacterium]|nr:AraC family transcriptional regulator [Spirochaetales bacterium]